MGQAEWSRSQIHHVIRSQTVQEKRGLGSNNDVTEDEALVKAATVAAMKDLETIENLEAGQKRDELRGYSHEEHSNNPHGNDNHWLRKFIVTEGHIHKALKHHVTSHGDSTKKHDIDQLANGIHLLAKKFENEKSLQLEPDAVMRDVIEDILKKQNEVPDSVDQEATYKCFHINTEKIIELMNQYTREVERSNVQWTDPNKIKGTTSENNAIKLCRKLDENSHEKKVVDEASEKSEKSEKSDGVLDDQEKKFREAAENEGKQEKQESKEAEESKHEQKESAKESASQEKSENQSEEKKEKESEKEHENWNKLKVAKIETTFHDRDPYTEIGASVVNGAGIRKSQLGTNIHTAKRRSNMTSSEDTQGLDLGDRPGHFIVKVQGKDFKDRLIGYLFDQLAKEEKRNEKSKEGIESKKAIMAVSEEDKSAKAIKDAPLKNITSEGEESKKTKLGGGEGDKPTSSGTKSSYQPINDPYAELGTTINVDNNKKKKKSVLRDADAVLRPASVNYLRTPDFREHFGPESVNPHKSEAVVTGVKKSSLASLKKNAGRFRQDRHE